MVEVEALSAAQIVLLHDATLAVEILPGYAEDARAPLGERKGRRAADSPAGPRDERDLPFHRAGISSP
jgi:hypothetical protein